MKITFTEPFSGNCPIQAEGLTVCGKPWYFRAREGVSLTVGAGNGHPLKSTPWRISDDQPDAPKFNSLDYPGWASHEACQEWLEEALECFEQWKALNSY